MIELYPKVGDTGYVDALIETFDTGFFQTAAGYGNRSELPVFIVGMPRSGTTLVEQIVASHPNAFGAGELNDIPRLKDRLPAALPSNEPFPRCAAALERPTAGALAAEYLASLRRRAPEAARITDKLPGNFLHLGFIALLFPRARVIHCLRDPLDTCISNYFTRFLAGHPYSYDLTNLGLYYREYERLMDHWRRTLPTAMLEVGYEDLVASQEAVSRRIIEFCGLEWDDRCLAFHKVERVVHTASSDQVRRPIYSSAVGRWQRYAKHLGPLREAMGAGAA